MGWDIPVVDKYRGSVLFKNNLPYRTGNLRHNAARSIFLSPGVRYVIDENEADYTRTVFDYYINFRGRNFMHAAAVDIYHFLLDSLNGAMPQWNDEYIRARKNVLATSKDSYERQVTNILHGSGMYADSNLKEYVLNEAFEASLTGTILR